MAAGCCCIKQLQANYFNCVVISIADMLTQNEQQSYERRAKNYSSFQLASTGMKRHNLSAVCLYPGFSLTQERNLRPGISPHLKTQQPFESHVHPGKFFYVRARG